MPPSIRRFVCFAVAGVIINLIVTALLALFVNVHAQRSVSAQGLANDLAWSLHTSAAFGSQRACSELERRPGNTTPTNPESLVPSWLPIPLIVTQPSNVQFAKSVFEARGWPLLSFWCGNEATIVLQGGTPSTNAPAGALSLPFSPWPTYFGGSLPRLLPFRPIWSGIIVNSFLYAFLAAGLFHLARNQVRLHRFTRGLCPGCAYNMRHVYSEPCPECGSFSAPTGVA